jgi:hypothetical protein
MHILSIGVFLHEEYRQFCDAKSQRYLTDGELLSTIYSGKNERGERWNVVCGQIPQKYQRKAKEATLVDGMPSMDQVYGTTKQRGI